MYTWERWTMCNSAFNATLYHPSGRSYKHISDQSGLKKWVFNDPKTVFIQAPKSLLNNEFTIHIGMGWLREERYEKGRGGRKVERKCQQQRPMETNYESSGTSEWPVDQHHHYTTEPEEEEQCIGLLNVTSFSYISPLNENAVTWLARCNAWVSSNCVVQY